MSDIRYSIVKTKMNIVEFIVTVNTSTKIKLIFLLIFIQQVDAGFVETCSPHKSNAEKEFTRMIEELQSFSKIQCTHVHYVFNLSIRLRINSFAKIIISVHLFKIAKNRLQFVGPR